MRPIDADNLRGRVCEIFLCAEPGSAEERRFALMLGLIDSEPTIVPPPNNPPPNAPLTLEELREMDGEPVWCAFSEGRGGYMIIQWHNSEFFKSFEFGFLLAEEYGKSWLAYRRKPEKGTQKDGLQRAD